MMYFPRSVLLLVLVIFVSTLCSAQQQCSSTISGTVNSNIECAGDCVLSGAIVNGNVQCSTGTLVIKDNSNVTGGVTVDGSVTRAEVDDAFIFGTLTVKDASSLTELVARAAARLSSVSVTNSAGNLLISGQLSSLTVTDSGSLTATDLTVTGSVSVTRGSGIVDICGSTLGGLSVLERTGDVEVDATKTNCAVSTIEGISASKGSGSVTVKDAVLSTFDFSVTEYTNGDVCLQGASVGDVLLQDVEGAVTLEDLTIDSDTTIGLSQLLNGGDVLIKNIITSGDFYINSVDGNLDIIDSNFQLEDVTITGVTGIVNIQNNMNFGFSVTESGGQVTISGNSGTDAGVTKNTGGVTINNNTFSSLSCSDNNPAPTGTGNTITLPDGQCSSGFP